MTNVVPSPRTSPQPSSMQAASQITMKLLSNCQRLSPEASPQVYRLDAKTVVKTGEVVRMSEAATMRLVREKTSIPVPRILDAGRREDGTGHVCILMEYVEGETLEKAWKTLDAPQKAGIIAQLRSYVDQLRAIRGAYIGCVDGTHCEDQFFSDLNDPTSYGPFQTESAFCDGLVRSLREREQGTWVDMICRFVKSVPPHNNIVLTHNDLAPQNILVRGGKVVAIIDWELAGYYPEHWEYVKAHFWPDWHSFWIKDGILDKILQPYVTELACLLHARQIISGW
jgi:serine/threonine protein kinase